jgi:hypothetical protein
MYSCFNYHETQVLKIHILKYSSTVCLTPSLKSCFHPGIFVALEINDNENNVCMNNIT